MKSEHINKTILYKKKMKIKNFDSSCDMM